MKEAQWCKGGHFQAACVRKFPPNEPHSKPAPKRRPLPSSEQAPPKSRRPNWRQPQPNSLRLLVCDGHLLACASSLCMSGQKLGADLAKECSPQRVWPNDELCQSRAITQIDLIQGALFCRSGCAEAEAEANQIEIWLEWSSSENKRPPPQTVCGGRGATTMQKAPPNRPTFSLCWPFEAPRVLREARPPNWPQQPTGRASKDCLTLARDASLKRFLETLSPNACSKCSLQTLSPHSCPKSSSQTRSATRFFSNLDCCKLNFIIKSQIIGPQAQAAARAAPKAPSIIGVQCDGSAHSVKCRHCAMCTVHCIQSTVCTVYSLRPPLCTLCATQRMQCASKIRLHF